MKLCGPFAVGMLHAGPWLVAGKPKTAFCKQQGIMIAPARSSRFLVFKAVFGMIGYRYILTSMVTETGCSRYSRTAGNFKNQVCSVT
jgi:hypothetical protein